jgi:hypothetical protein
LEILGGGHWLVTISQLVCGGFSFLVAVGRFCANFWSAFGDLWWRHVLYFWLGFPFVGILVLVLVLGFSLIIGAVSVDFTGAIFCVLQ